MKQSKRLLTLLMVLVMAIASLSAFATEHTSQALDTVLATFAGKDVLKSQCDALIAQYAQQMPVSYQQAVSSFLSQYLFEDQIVKLGLDTYTDDEIKAIEAEAQGHYDNAIAEYVKYFLSEDTQEAREQVAKEAVQYYDANGVTVEGIANDVKTNKSFDRLFAHIMDGFSVSNEEITAQYDTMVAEQMELIGDDVTSYEIYSQYYGQLFYMPKGYRSVLHILLMADEALQTEYQDANTAYEEVLGRLNAPATETTDETAEPVVPSTQEEVDAAKATLDAVKTKIMESKQAKIDEIQTRLEAGEAFADLALEYGEDPGLDVKVGYNVHADSMMWDPSFRDAAFSDKMQKVGDVSDPVVGSYGVHILYYLADVQEGPIAITQEVVAQMRQSMENNAMQEKQLAFYEEHVGEYEVTVNQEEIEKLDNPVPELGEVPAEETNSLEVVETAE